MNAAAFPLNYFVKKWYDICLEAKVAEDEVLEDEEAKKDLTKEKIEYLLDLFGYDVGYKVIVTDDKEIIFNN